MRTRHAVATVLFFLVSSPTNLFSQTVSTEIFGLVTDSSGAVIPSATLRITRVATRDVRTAITNDSGNYVFPLLDIGDYEVTCVAPGFKTAPISHLTELIERLAPARSPLGPQPRQHRIGVAS